MIDLMKPIPDDHPMYSAPNPSSSGSDRLRTVDTSGTVLQRAGNFFTIICESGEVANRVADQLRTPIAVAQAPSINETETILDAINDYSPRARQTVDLILYKFDVRLRPESTVSSTQNKGDR